MDHQYCLYSLRNTFISLFDVPILFNNFKVVKAILIILIMGSVFLSNQVIFNSCVLYFLIMDLLSMACLLHQVIKLLSVAIIDFNN